MVEASAHELVFTVHGGRRSAVCDALRGCEEFHRWASALEFERCEFGDFRMGFEADEGAASGDCRCADTTRARERIDGDIARNAGVYRVQSKIE